MKNAQNAQPDINTDKSNVLLDSEATAQMINVDIRTIERWRQRRCGPPFLRLSHHCVRYRLSDLEEWCANRRIECAG
jgi:hypothetical protein